MVEPFDAGKDQGERQDGGERAVDELAKGAALHAGEGEAEGDDEGLGDQQDGGEGERPAEIGLAEDVVGDRLGEQSGGGGPSNGTDGAPFEATEEGFTRGETAADGDFGGDVAGEGALHAHAGGGGGEIDPGDAKEQQARIMSTEAAGGKEIKAELADHLKPTHAESRGVGTQFLVAQPGQQARRIKPCR